MLDFIVNAEKIEKPEAKVIFMNEKSLPGAKMSLKNSQKGCIVTRSCLKTPTTLCFEPNVPKIRFENI